MNYVEFKAGENTYKLRMNTRAVCDLERKLGTNPINVFMNMQDGILPKVTDMILILAAALQQYQHGIKESDVFDIFDNYIADGHGSVDFVNEMYDILNVSGLIADSKEESDPNA